MIHEGKRNHGFEQREAQSNPARQPSRHVSVLQTDGIDIIAGAAG